MREFRACSESAMKPRQTSDSQKRNDTLFRRKESLSDLRELRKSELEIYRCIPTNSLQPFQSELCIFPDVRTFGEDWKAFTTANSGEPINGQNFRTKWNSVQYSAISLNRVIEQTYLNTVHSQAFACCRIGALASDLQLYFTNLIIPKAHLIFDLTMRKLTEHFPGNLRYANTMRISCESCERTILAITSPWPQARMREARAKSNGKKTLLLQHALNSSMCCAYINFVVGHIGIIFACVHRMRHWA